MFFNRTNLHLTVYSTHYTVCVITLYDSYHIVTDDVVEVHNVPKNITLDEGQYHTFRLVLKKQMTMGVFFNDDRDLWIQTNGTKVADDTWE